MQADDTRYRDAYARFTWDIPERFNIAEAICERHARTTPDAPALIVETDTGEVTTYSFAIIDRAATKLASALSGQGLNPGDVIAIHLPQSVETLIAHVAAQKLGAIALPMFNLFGPEAVSYRLEDSGARALITSTEGLGRIGLGIAGIASLNAIICVGGHGEGATHEFWPFLDTGAEGLTSAPTRAGDPALLMYTSGTTGNPKGVLHAGRVLLGHLPGVIYPHENFPQPGDKFWTPADWAWAGGLLDVLLPSLYFGVPVVAAPRTKFDAEWAFELMARHNIRNVFMPPTALRLMASVQNPERFGVRLRSLASGGETLGADMLAWGERTFGIPINEFYGQTEVNLVVGNCAALFPVKPGSMGRALPGHIVEVIGADGTVASPGEVGTVGVKADPPNPVMALTYWQKPQAWADKFRGPWCLLGDLATKDAQGHFWYHGRDDDVINSSGYRIGPGEVEACLLRHAAIAQAGVIGSSDALRGEIVAAYIVLKPGFAQSAELEADIQGFVKRELAAHEYPRKIRFLSELPMTITGKLRRMDLRAMDVEEKGKA